MSGEKKTPVMAATITLAISIILSGCGNGEQQTPASITFLHYFTDSLSGGIDELAKTFNKENPGYNLVPTPLDHETFKTTIRIQLDGPNPPDLFSYWAGARTQYLVDRGVLEPIDRAFESGIPSDAFSASILGACTYNGSIYMLPLTRHYVGFFYNIALFEEAGVDVPETWDELVAAADRFKAAGIVPFSMGAVTRWPAQFWFDYLMLRTYGNDIRRALTSGNLAYDSEEVLTAFDQWKGLLDRGYFNSDVLTLDWDEAALRVAQGDAAMTLMGTWVIALYDGEDYVPDQDYGFFPFPRVNEGIPDVALGPIDGVLVSAGSRNKDTALAVLERLADPGPQASFNAGSGAIAPRSGVSDDIYGPIQLRIKDLISRSPAWAFNYDLAVPPEEAEAGLNMLVAFLRDPSRYAGLLSDLEKTRRNSSTSP